MSISSNKLKDILSRNRAKLGLINLKESKETNSSNENYILDSNVKLPIKEEQLIDLKLNLSTPLEQQSYLNISSESLINKNTLTFPKMEVEKFKLAGSMLPQFSGEPEELEVFIEQVDPFNNTFYGANEEQNRFTFSMIFAKITGDAKKYCMRNPGIRDWNNLKLLLQRKYGDPISYQTLFRELQSFRINKNENLMQFVDRLKTFCQRVTSKMYCEIPDQNLRTVLATQIEQTAITILSIHSPPILQSTLDIKNPETLDDAYKLIYNYELKRNHEKTFFNHTQPNKPPQNSFARDNHTNHSRFDQTQRFPTNRPITIQPRRLPPQRFPTNAQVFGNPRNVFAPQNKNRFSQQNNPPTPMSTTSAMPSRIQHSQRQNPQNHYSNNTNNHFQSNGPRNFISQELTNVETQNVSQYDDNFPYENYTDPVNENIQTDEPFYVYHNQIENFEQNESTDNNNYPQPNYDENPNFQEIPLNKPLT